MIYSLIIAALLLFASQRWPAFGTALRFGAFVVCAVGLIILTKVGYTFEFLKVLIMAPVNFLAGIVGIVYHLLFG